MFLACSLISLLRLSTCNESFKALCVQELISGGLIICETPDYLYWYNHWCIWYKSREPLEGIGTHILDGKKNFHVHKLYKVAPRIDNSNNISHLLFPIYSTTCAAFSKQGSYRHPRSLQTRTSRVRVFGCSNRMAGPATTLSNVGAPGSSVMTAMIMPFLSNSAGIVETLVVVSNGTEILNIPWKYTA